MFRRTLIVTAIALLAASLAACGESSEEKATAKLCDARAGIAEEVDQLKGITVTTATSSKISASLQSIRDDLSTIAEARRDLSEDRRAQVDKANDTFRRHGDRPRRDAAEDDLTRAGAGRARDGARRSRDQLPRQPRQDRLPLGRAP